MPPQALTRRPSPVHSGRERSLLAKTALYTALLACTLGAPRAHPAAGPSTHAAQTAARADMPDTAAGSGQPLVLSHGRFKDLHVYPAAAPARSVALLLSGDEGWAANADAAARRLSHDGALVIGVDLKKFKAELEADGDTCESPDGDLENLSHFIQAYVHSPSYAVPLLVGVSTGASFAYAMLAQAPPNTFAGGLSTGFCPALGLKKPLCKGIGLDTTHDARGNAELVPAHSLSAPFVALLPASGGECPLPTARAFLASTRGAAAVVLPALGQSQTAAARGLAPLAAAYDTLAVRNPTASIAAPPADLKDLPVIELPPTAAAPSASGSYGSSGGAATVPTDVFAIILSGDGGWAGLDRDVATALTARGIPVIGLDSLRYFWTARTPAGLAGDIDRMIRYYLPHLGKQRVLLIGYSQGADVLPFAVNRLPPATRARVALAAVLGMSEHALFEFHLSSWVSDDNSGPATLPEIDRIKGTPLLCIYGKDETDTLCPKLDPKRFEVVGLEGGHHFDGDYAGLARSILAAAH